MRKNALFCALCMVLITTQHLSAADYVTKIITGVVKADSWTEETASAGIYRLEVKDTPTLTQLSEGNDVLIAPLGGAVYVDGQMQGIHFKTTYDPYTSGNTYTIFHVGYDMQDWTQTKKYAMDNLYANLISSCGLAHDPETGLNYGIFYNFNMDMQVINRKLATIDFSTDKPTKSNIDVVETPFAAIAIGPDGWLYALGLIFVLVTLFLPKGIVGIIGMIRAKQAERKALAAADAAREAAPAAEPAAAEAAPKEA